MKSNRKVIVAGGSGLIGKTVVKAFQANGDKVLNADITPYGENWISFSLSKPNSIYVAINKLAGVDVFVNCTYSRAFHNHTISYKETSDIVASEMAKGVIIHIASIYGILAPISELYEGCDEMIQPSCEYAMEKAAIIQMTRWMAKRYAPNVRVNCISPGGVFDNQPKEFVERYERRTPLRRMATPDDISSVVLFLASNLSQYITGQNLVVDGGFTL